MVNYKTSDYHWIFFADEFLEILDFAYDIKSIYGLGQFFPIYVRSSQLSPQEN